MTALIGMFVNNVGIYKKAEFNNGLRVNLMYLIYIRASLMFKKNLFTS